VILANSGANPAREVKVVQRSRNAELDGVIITASRVGAMHARMLQRMEVPIVLLNNHTPGRFAHSVMIDNVEASHCMVRHLLELGHRPIAYIGDRFGGGSDSERFSGYRAALDEADAPFQPELVVHGDGKPPEVQLALLRCCPCPNRQLQSFATTT
jgi:LacI family transcriptional regulator